MKKILLILTPIFTLNACEASPLLNHDNADDLKNTSIQAANAECPLDYPEAGLCAKVEWIVGPTLMNIDDTCVVKFWDKETGSINGPYVDPEDFVVINPWMKSEIMDHGTAPVTVTKEDTGVYKGTRIFFSMTGAWQFRVELRDGPTVKDTNLIEGAQQIINIR